MPLSTATLAAAQSPPISPPWFLTAVFAIHLAVFGTLLLRRRQGRYGLLVATFMLLMGAIWLPFTPFDVPLGGGTQSWTGTLHVSSLLRGAAYPLGTLALVVIVRDRWRRWRG